MDDLIEEFLAETNESLDELDNDLVNLEQNPNDVELLSKIFRLMHTIKGTCGFLDLPRLEKVAHHAENVLGKFRDGDLEVTPDYVTLIFESLDVIKEIVTKIEETGSEPDEEYADLIRKLDDVYEGRTSSENSDNSESVAADDEKSEVTLEVVASQGTPEESNVPDIEPDEHGFVPVPAASAQQPAASPPKEEKPSAPAAKKTEDKEVSAPVTSAPASTQTLRVNVDVLENLMTMVSELVLTRNQLLQILRIQSDSDFSTPLQRLNHVVSDLQEGVMKTRMQPIGNAWSKLPRIIRDLALELNKKIELKMLGQETELDRQVLDLIKDPLTHMVRNSADHGIEDPETRTAAGKPETGTVTLNAYHEGGHIIIKIQDDGKGLSTEKIISKILENGLATQSELDNLTTQQIQQYIFKAGFSTAEAVTAVSGRGVGMDVVRTNIEKIGGSIDLNSVEGKGSTFTIKIPLTLAIVSALIVESGKERFAIPQLSVQELVMASNTGDNKIEHIKGTPVFRLRNHLLPLVFLDDLLKIKIPSTASNESKAELIEQAIDGQEIDGDQKENVEENRNHYIVVTQVGNYSFGIIVDKVFDTEEIVVKPVANILKSIDIFSGNTILGDGSVIMILDPNGIARSIGEVDAGENATAESAADALKSEVKGDAISLLLFAAGSNAPKAVPLSLVARLENIDMATVEYSGSQMLVQYRGDLMPIVPFSNNVTLGDTGEKPVLVFSDKGRSMGIIVDQIIDITEEAIDIKVEGETPGLMGSSIIHDKATDIVDVGYYLKRVNANWFKDHGDEPYLEASTDLSKTHVLLVDDSPFFRNMITPLLITAGYRVTSLESAVEALELCEKGSDEFDMIISDIEMPDMSGFEFAEIIKKDSNWKNTPMVALTSHENPKDIDHGLSVGFEKYIPKFDRDVLLNTISQTLSEKLHKEAS